MKKKKRLGKELKFKINGYSIKYGTLNKEMPNVIYLRARTRIKPVISIDYCDSLKVLKKSFYSFIADFIKHNEDLANDYIAQLLASESGLKYNKTILLKFDIYVRVKSPINFIEYFPTAKKMSSDICEQINKILNDNHIDVVYNY